MIISEYARKFLELDWYSPESMMDEGRKTIRFEWGLRPNIRQPLFVLELNTYSAVLGKAHLAERSFCTFLQAVGNLRPSAPHCRSTPTAPVQQNKRPRPMTQAPPQVPVAGCGKICQYYGKDHGDWTCYRLNNTCHIYGSAQHYATECSRNQNQTRPPIKGIAYNLTQQDVETNLDVVQGMYTICNHLVHVLIDTGTSHSFVSYIFASKLDVSPEKLDFVLFISTLGSRTLLGEVVYRACVIDIADRKLSVNLIETDTKNFNVILEMN